VPLFVLLDVCGVMHAPVHLNQIPWQASILLALLGAGGGTTMGYGPWASVARAAAEVPVLQAAAVGASRVAASWAGHGYSGWMAMGTAAAALAFVAGILVGAAGGLAAGRCCWYRRPRLHPQLEDTLAAAGVLAKQLVAGGPAAHRAAAISLDVSDADLSTWIRQWNDAIVGPGGGVGHDDAERRGGGARGHSSRLWQAAAAAGAAAGGPQDNFLNLGVCTDSPPSTIPATILAVLGASADPASPMGPLETAVRRAHLLHLRIRHQCLHLGLGCVKLPFTAGLCPNSGRLSAWIN
jgi:hypothetical protein